MTIGGSKRIVGLVEGREARRTLSARPWAVVSCVAAAVLLTSSLAVAQTQESQGEDGSYGYEFEDDPLNAGGFGPNDATIRVRANAARTTLIRPRTSFVPEMLKSVEDL